MFMILTFLLYYSALQTFMYTL